MHLNPKFYNKSLPSTIIFDGQSRWKDQPWCWFFSVEFSQGELDFLTFSSSETKQIPSNRAFVRLFKYLLCLNQTCQMDSQPTQTKFTNDCISSWLSSWHQYIRGPNSRHRELQTLMAGTHSGQEQINLDNSLSIHMAWTLPSAVSIVP